MAINWAGHNGSRLKTRGERGWDFYKPEASKGSKRPHYGPFGFENSASDANFGTVASLVNSGRTLATGGSGDLHLRGKREMMANESQRLYETNGLFYAIIERCCDVILGEDGLTLQAMTSSKRANTWLEDLWRDHGDDTTVQGGIDWSTELRLALKCAMVGGDIGAIKDDATRQIQFIEEGEIGTLKQSPMHGGDRIEDGVEVTHTRKPVGFYVQDYTPEGHARVSDRYFEAAKFLFMKHWYRPSMIRGVPVLQVNFPMFHRINDVLDSEAMAWQLLSRFAVAIYQKDAAALSQLKSEGLTNAEAEDLVRRSQDVSDYAIAFYGSPGDQIEGIARNIPGQNFPESIRMYLRILGLSVGLPLEWVLLDWSNVNYSSGRAGSKQTERLAKPWHRMLRLQWCKPRYHWIVDLSRSKAPRYVRDRSDLFRHWFHEEPLFVMDETKKEEAREKRQANGRSSPQREAKRDGERWEDGLQENVEAITAYLEEQEKLNKKFPSANLTLGAWTPYGRPETRKAFPVGGGDSETPDDTKRADDAETE